MVNSDRLLKQYSQEDRVELNVLNRGVFTVVQHHERWWKAQSTWGNRCGARPRPYPSTSSPPLFKRTVGSGLEPCKFLPFNS